MGTDRSVNKRAPARRGILPNAEWLVRQVQMRCWTLADFAAACERTGERVSMATLSNALNGERVDGSKYAAMLAAIQTNDPIIPEEAIA